MESAKKKQQAKETECKEFSSKVTLEWNEEQTMVVNVRIINSGRQISDVFSNLIGING